MKLIPLAQPLTGHYMFLYPSKASAQLNCAGDIAYNTGLIIEAILEHPAQTSGKVVPLVTDTFTMAEMTARFAAVTETRALYVELSDADMDAMFSVFGQEMAAQFRWSEVYPDWTAAEPERTVQPTEIGVAEGDLRGFDATIKELKDLIL
jgi:hypothetical protein